MPLDIKHHTVPHLKGLNNGIDPSTRWGCGRTFTLHHTTFQSVYFHSLTGNAVVSYEHICRQYGRNVDLHFNFYSKKYECFSNKTEHAVYSYTVGKPEFIAIVIFLSNAKNAVMLGILKILGIYSNGSTDEKKIAHWVTTTTIKWRQIKDGF